MAQRVKNKPELKIVVSNTPEAPAVEPVPEQVEMPFAIVNGEPVTQMPKDLYIPPQAMEVFLEAFEGPLDLLLYLIRRQNLNILDIPLAEITRQYMQYIEVMTELQLELAGEYMVMAATLAEIKSRMLLPRPKVDPDGKEEDPRAELVRRLQEYERFKRAAESIDTLPRLERDVWMASAELKDRSVVKLLPTVTLQEMLLAFKDVVIRSEMFAHHHISRERLSVRERMSDVLTRLEHASFVEFVHLFRLEEGRMGVTVTFMALLELVREGLIEIVQAVPFAPLHVRAAGAGRKLHIVGGNEALADGTVALADGTVALADGTLVDGTSAVVVGEAVVGDVPAVGLLMPGDAGLDSIVEQVLDPNFVDEDFDEDEGPLEGVDDVVDRVAAPAEPAIPAESAAPVEPATPAELAEPGAPSALEPAVGLADVGFAGAGAGVAGAIGLIDVLAAPGIDDTSALQSVSLVDLPSVSSTVEPVSVVDEWAANVDPAAVTYAQAVEGFPSAALTGEVDFHEATASGETAQAAPAALATDSTSSPVAHDQPISTDTVAAAVDSVLVAGSAEFSPAATDIAQTTIATQQISTYEVASQQTSAYEIAAAEFAESPSESGDAVVASATELDEAGAVAEPVSGFASVADPFEPAVNSFDPATISTEPAPVITDAVSDAGVIADEASPADHASSSGAAPFVGHASSADEATVAGQASFAAAASSAGQAPVADEPSSGGWESVADEASSAGLVSFAEEASSAGHGSSAIAAIDQPPPVADAVDAAVTSVLADVPAATVEYPSTVDQGSHTSSVTGDMGASEVVESASALHPTAGFDQVAVTIGPTSTLDAFATGVVDDSPLRREPTVSADPTAALDETSAVVELAPTDDLSPLADLVTTNMSASAAVVTTGEASSPDSPTSDFLAPVVDLPAPDVPLTADSAAPTEAASSDGTTGHVSAPLSDVVTTALSEAVSVVPTDEAASPDLTAVQVSAPLSDLVATDVSDPVDFVATVDVASPDSAAAHVTASVSELVATEASDPVDFVAPDEVASPDLTGDRGTASSSNLVAGNSLTPEHMPSESWSSSAVGDVASPDMPSSSDDLPAADAPTSVGDLPSADAPTFVGGLPSADAPSSSFGEPAVSVGTSGDDIAVTFDASVTTPTAVADEPLLTAVSAAASEPAAAASSASEPTAVEPAAIEPIASDDSSGSPIVEPSANDEVGVTVDPAVFDAPTATAGSEPPEDTSLDEPPAVDVEYESPEEAVAAGEQPAVDEDVSLIGDTPVAGEASLVGDESVSGGPAVEVEEFAFDELPALDDARPADQQPAAGAETVVNKVSGADEPPSPGEESDD